MSMMEKTSMYIKCPEEAVNNKKLPHVWHSNSNHIPFGTGKNHKRSKIYFSNNKRSDIF
jgi:hypothetical protein